VREHLEALGIVLVIIGMGLCSVGVPWVLDKLFGG
jgi:hypothetical protein